jgi:myotubularin-related protein 6/7/8
MFVLQALIEKDWLAFGHKFSERCGHVAGDPKEVSPVFTQFIDCIWQLTQQFPATFQFNERFLLTVHDHVQSCQFGTFIGNCEKDRVDLRCVCTQQLCFTLAIV